MWKIAIYSYRSEKFHEYSQTLKGSQYRPQFAANNCTTSKSRAWISLDQMILTTKAACHNKLLQWLSDMLKIQARGLFPPSPPNLPNLKLSYAYASDFNLVNTNIKPLMFHNSK